MLAITQISIIGSEKKLLGNTYINHARSSGWEIIDVIVNGYSKNFDLITVDNYTGLIMIQEELERGDLVQVLYKMIPKIGTGYLPEFSSLDFNNDFVI